MNNIPLTLAAPRIAAVVRTLLVSVLSAGCLIADGYLDRISHEEGQNAFLLCLLFGVVTLAAACFFCAFLDAVLCLARRRTIVLTNDTLQVYNLAPVRVEDIEAVTLLPQDTLPKTLTVSVRDGRTVRIRQRDVNLPLETLQSAIQLRISYIKNNTTEEFFQ